VQAASTPKNPLRFDAMMRGAGMSLLLNAVCPWAAYQWLTARDVDTVTALAATAVFPIVGTLLGWRRSGRPDILGVLSVSFIALSVTVALVTENPLVVLLRGSISNTVFAILCFGSLAFARPLMFYVARQFVAGWDRVAANSFEQQWQVPGFRRTMRQLTVVWGCWFAVQAVGRVVAVQLLPVSTFLVAWPPISTVGTLGQMFWSMRYAGRGAQLRHWDPVEDGAHLDDSARLTLGRAEEEARQFRHRLVSTEHLLIALCEDDSPAAQALRNVGVTAATARTTLDMMLAPGNASRQHEVSYTHWLDTALRRADEARLAAGASQIGTEHLLMALLEEDGHLAASMLTYMGVDLAGLRARLLATNEPSPK
jgi:hypothetical protein